MGEPTSHLIKDKGRHSASPAKVQGDRLCSLRGNRTPHFTLKEGRCPGEGGGQLPLPSAAGKATFNTAPPTPKLKKQTKSNQKPRTKELSTTITYRKEKGGDTLRKTGFQKRSGAFHQKTWKMHPLFPACVLGGGELTRKHLPPKQMRVHKSPHPEEPFTEADPKTPHSASVRLGGGEPLQ